MKKNFKSYAVCWLVLFALFNVIAFVSPGWEEYEKYTGSFWTGYIFITLAFLGQLACSYFAFKAENATKLFYNLPIITLGYAGLVVSFVVGGLCMLISPLPYWVAVIICCAVLAVYVIAVMKASAASDIVESTDKKIKAQTAFIKSLTVDAQGLVSRAKSESAKAECQKVYEAVRYSDPMSNDALAGDEAQISMKFAELSAAVDNADDDKIAAAATSVLILLDMRNKKCRLMK